MDKIAVLIPCYNEEKTVEKVVSDFKRVLPEAVVYVYNNNSNPRNELLDCLHSIDTELLRKYDEFHSSKP